MSGRKSTVPPDELGRIQEVEYGERYIIDVEGGEIYISRGGKQEKTLIKWREEIPFSEDEVIYITEQKLLATPVIGEPHHILQKIPEWRNEDIVRVAEGLRGRVYSVSVGCPQGLRRSGGDREYRVIIAGDWGEAESLRGKHPNKKIRAFCDSGCGWGGAIAFLWAVILEGGGEVYDCKEKFGLLRVYSPLTITLPELLTVGLCWECGDIAYTMVSLFGYISTLCPKHYREYYEARLKVAGGWA